MLMPLLAFSLVSGSGAEVVFGPLGTIVRGETAETKDLGDEEEPPGTNAFKRIMKSRETLEGIASWYGPGFNGRPMANGEIYNQNEVLVAHRTLPLGTVVRVTHAETGESIIAEVKDRGPYILNDEGKYTREIDLSYAAARALDAVGAGLIPVTIEKI